MLGLAAGTGIEGIGRPMDPVRTVQAWRAGAARRISSALPALLSAAVFALSLALSLRGSEWERGLHPDEAKIVRWEYEIRRDGYLRDRVYPTGFFRMAEWVRGLERDSPDARRRAAWTRQEGAGSAARDASRGARSAEPEDLLLFYRKFNAWLAAFGALFAFWTALVVLKRRAPAFLAGLLVALNPLHVEFAHYCETDATMIFTVSLTFLLSALALDRKSAALSLLAALSAGFAFSCKYTLLPLLAVAPATAFLAVPGRRGRRAALALAAAALAVAGFLYGTPAVVRDWAFFKAGSASAKARTFAEIKGILGEMARTPGAAAMYKARQFLDEARKLGAAWWAWLLLAAPLWASGRLRRQFPAVPLFTLLFALYVAFGLPWFRSQEFLPLVVPVALTTVLPLLFAGRIRRRGLRVCALAGAATVVLAFGARSAVQSARCLSAFAHKDERVTMRDWLAESCPRDVPLDLDAYATFMDKTLPMPCVHVKNPEQRYPESFSDTSGKYYVMVENMVGRGAVHPWTRAYYPDIAARVADFTNRCERVLTFRASDDGLARPTFASADAELWRIVRENAPDRGTGLGDIPLVLPRPARLAFGGETYYPAQDMTAVGPELALRNIGRRSSVALRFDKDDAKETYAVSRFLGSHAGAELAWKSGFRPQKSGIPDGRAVLSRLGGSGLGLEMRRAADTLPTFRVRMRSADKAGVGVTTVTRSPLVAADLLRRNGAPDEAADLLAGLAAAEHPDDGTLVAAALALAGAGRGGEITREMRDAARRTLDTAEALLDAAAENRPGWKETTLLGTSLEAYLDFARIRLHGLVPERMDPSQDAAAGAEAARIPLPLVLVPGKYRLACTFKGGAALDPAAFDAGFSDRHLVMTSRTPTASRDDELDLVLEFTATRTVCPTLLVNPGPGVPGALEVLDFELTWNVLDLLAAEAESLRAAEANGKF